MDASTEHGTQSDKSRGVGIIARSLFREMQQQGYSPEQIIGVSSELLNLVSADIRDDVEAAE